LIAIGIWYVVERTDFGARLRAAVDNPRMARCAGINVRRIFSFTFTVGCGLAAVGGVLGTQMLPIEPYYALSHLILVLIVVATGGLGSLKGSFTAALVIGVLDTYGRYILPSGGGFVMYAIVLVVLLARPQGLFARA
jgi:branched-chain amino acid transport system permease protein